MAMTEQRLRACFPSLGEKLGESDRKALLEALAPQSLEEGQVLLEWGAQTDAMHMVEEGLLSVYIAEGDRKLVLGQAGPGMVVGEIGMIEPGVASATVAAIAPTTVLSLSHGSFEKLCESAPGAASVLLGGISKNLVQRMRNAGAGLRRIDEHTWMKQQAKQHAESWRHRLAAMLIGGEKSR